MHLLVVEPSSELALTRDLGLGIISACPFVVSLPPAFTFHPPNSNDHLPPSITSSSLLEFPDVCCRLPLPLGRFRTLAALVLHPCPWKSEMARSVRRHRSLDRSERRDCEIVGRVLVRHGSEERTMDSDHNGGGSAGYCYVAASIWKCQKR